MKKIFSLCLILCLAISLCASITVIAFADETETPTVYVYDEQGWDLNVYCYTSSGDFGSGWPGMSLDPAPEMGEDWYSFVFPQSIKGVTGLHIIVFDKNDDQVNRFDSVYSAGKNYYNTYNANGFDTAKKAMDDAVAKRPKLVDTIYIYNYSIADKEERWNNISAACYDNATNEQLSDVVTLTGATALGANWYKYDLPQAAKDKAAEDYKFRAKVVVYDGDDNRNQLAIVAPVAAKPYYNTYRTYGFDSAATASGAEMNCVYKDPKTGTTRLYFYNSQRWKTVYAYGYWTYTAANNTNVEDFGGWPGQTMFPDENRENWYYIDLPQDIDVIKAAPYNATNGVGIAFNDSKGGKAELAISSKTNVYVNYNAEARSSYAAIESITEMVAPIPPIDNFMLDFSQLTTEGTTETATNKADIIAPIVVFSVATALLIAAGVVFAVLTIRRSKKNDK